MDSLIALLVASVCWWGLHVRAAPTTVPKCVAEDITKIKQHWATAGGTPKNILGLKDTYRVVSGTNSVVADAAKCSHYSFSRPTAQGQPFILNVHESNTHTPIKEKDGVLILTGPDGNIYFYYIIFYGPGIITSYKCSENGPVVSATNLADVTVTATSSAKREDIAAATTILTGMGFAIVSFNCQ